MLVGCEIYPRFCWHIVSKAAEVSLIKIWVPVPAIVGYTGIVSVCIAYTGTGAVPVFRGGSRLSEQEWKGTRQDTCRLFLGRRKLEDCREYPGCPFYLMGRTWMRPDIGTRD